MEVNIDMRAESAVGKGLLDWWRGLEDDRSTRAQLRRCATLDQIVLSPAYQQFYRYMLARGWPDGAAPGQLDKLAAIAALAAWIEVNNEANLPYQMSERDGERNVVSELRFRGLLRLDSTDELFRGLRRALPMIGHKTSVIQMANDVFWWSDATRKRWAYNYRWNSKPAA